MTMNTKFGTGKQFGSTPGAITKNSPLAGQNLPNLTGIPAAIGGDRTLVNRGPRILAFGDDMETTSGPGDPPIGFVGGTTSLSEWYLFWAFEKILGPEGVEWSYQESYLGGRGEAGGAVVDYVVYQPHRRIGVRLQTYRFHQNVDAFKQAHDMAQLVALSAPDFIVIDVYEDQIIHDETGQAAIQVVLDIINENEYPNPLASGFVVGTG